MAVQVLFETTSALLLRLQSNVCEEPVKICVSPQVKPAIVEQSSLTAVSKYFFRDFNPDNNYAWFNGIEQMDREYDWSNHTSEARIIFLYWLVNKRTPYQSEITILSLGADQGYQCLLAQAYSLAQEKSVLKMTNDVMRQFIPTLLQTELTVTSIQAMLKKPALTAGTMLRLAICEEVIFLERRGKQLLKHLDLRWALRFDGDMYTAQTRFTARGKVRGKAEDFFVEVTSPSDSDVPPRPPRRGPRDVDFSRLAEDIMRPKPQPRAKRNFDKPRKPGSRAPIWEPVVITRTFRLPEGTTLQDLLPQGTMFADDIDEEMLSAVEEWDTDAETLADTATPAGSFIDTPADLFMDTPAMSIIADDSTMVGDDATMAEATPASKITLLEAENRHLIENGL
ncbi:hypothetical protein LTR78_000033 [Recurvomyces mirabilis]|uniref:Uncharacterized protein n=1 Tax=Recurvomyces mirabilis TaxID=574656 RepID=A0AAE0WXA5_9PEZI|nr:hypothetical protein LTR78_000033 [Recurvomyces mirabilis]KAK5161690.1 hypothetical protein LTS14_000034 [Recurvomyces mirabilis]